MAMEISSNYGNYYNSAVYSTAENGQTEKTKSEKAQSSGDKVQEYYEKLCKKFPKIKINASGGIASSSRNNIVLNLSKDCLKKMAADPEFAKKIENDIAGIPAAHEQTFAKAQSDGIELYGVAVRINADGSMQCSCSGSTRSSGTKQSSSLLSTDRKKERLEKMRKEKEEMEARIEEKRWEKAEFEKRLKERRLEREAYLEYFVEENSSIKQYKSVDMAQSPSFFDTNA